VKTRSRAAAWLAAAVVPFVLFFGLPASAQLAVGADVSIDSSDAPDPADVGEQVTYTLTVSNAGPEAALAVTVADAPPLNATFVSFSASQGDCQQLAVLTCNLGTLAPGADGTVSIVVEPLTPGVMINSATVATAVLDPDLTNNVSTETTVVDELPIPVADVSIDKSDSPDPATVGNDLTYTLVVHNAGPGAAENVTVADVLPAAITFDSVSTDTGTCQGGPAIAVACQLGTLGSGDTATITIHSTPQAPGIAVNTATVVSTTLDLDPLNNVDTETTTIGGGIVPTADLRVDKSDSPDPVNVGEDLTYTIVVTNDGPDAASLVTMTDVLPATVTLQSVSTDTGDCVEAPVVVCTIGDLADGAHATMTIVVTPNVPGPLENAAVVAGAAIDPDLTNNVDVEGTTVEGSLLPVADLHVTMTDSPDPVKSDKTLTYVVNVTNQGPGSALAVTVADLIPSSTGFQSVSSVGNTCVGGQAVACQLGTINSGATEKVTIKVSPQVAGTIENQVTAASASIDLDLLDNIATVQTLVTDVSRLCNGLYPTIIGTTKADTLLGTAELDVISGIKGNDSLFGGLGNDALCGRGGDDTLHGESGADFLFGGPHADTMIGGPGADEIRGALGRDTVSYADAAGGVTVRLGGHTANGLNVGSDFIDGVERVIGSAFADDIGGNATANELIGGGGNDRLSGGVNNDRLVGGLGNDDLDGGEDWDVCDQGLGSGSRLRCEA
jgi:uncharacterized repeat protein (TIGR01451 family)